MYSYLCFLTVYQPLHNLFIVLLKKENKPRVFCIGNIKTGTNSLYKALSILGFRVVRFPFWHIYNKKGCERYIEKIIKCNYDAFVEYPMRYSEVWQKIDKAIPGSKFILTTRDSITFKRSYKNYFQGGPLERNAKELDQLVNNYEKENKLVINYFKEKPTKLLIINIIKGDGWEKLCFFLKKPIPKQSFPHNNKGRYNK